MWKRLERVQTAQCGASARKLSHIFHTSEIRRPEVFSRGSSFCLVHQRDSRFASYFQSGSGAVRVERKNRVCFMILVSFS